MAIILNSCSEEIELNLDPEQYSRLIVQAKITDLYDTQTIILKKTSPYDSHEPNPSAEGALVTVSDGENTYLFTEEIPGTYKNLELKGQVGRTYTLNIEYDGESYSAVSKMHKTIEIDSLGFKRFNMGIPADKPHFTVMVYGQDCDTPDQFYMFQYAVNGVWNDTLLYNSMAMYSDAVSNGEYLNGYNVAIIETYEKELEIQVRSLSINEQYFWFMDACVFNYMPNMFFSPPKATVFGNISNDALGFFLATSIRESEVYRVVAREIK